MPEVFAVPIFFIVFRETLETTIVVSVLLSFLKQQLGPDRDRTVYKKLRKQVCRNHTPRKEEFHHLPSGFRRSGMAP